MVGADLLILLSDIDGLYTDDPHTNPDAQLVKEVENLDQDILGMAKGTTGSNVGTGGMTTKLTAAKIATLSGTDMIHRQYLERNSSPGIKTGRALQLAPIQKIMV